MPDDHRPRSDSRLSRTRPPGCVRRFASQARLREGTWVQIIAVDVQYCRPLTDAHRPRSACRNVRTWPPGCVRFFVSRTISWSSRSSRQFLPERLGQFPRGKVPARPRTGRVWLCKRSKEVERKPQPLGTIGLIRCFSLPKKEEGKGAAASVQTIPKKMVGMSTGQ